MGAQVSQLDPGACGIWPHQVQWPVVRLQQHRSDLPTVMIEIHIIIVPVLAMTLDRAKIPNGDDDRNNN